MSSCCAMAPPIRTRPIPIRSTPRIPPTSVSSTTPGALAKSMGEALHKLKIPVGKVQTSLFQRAVDTGTLLGFGEVSTTVDIAEGGLVVSPNENNRRAAALRMLAGTSPPAGTNILLVTHKPNILDAFGKDWFDVREGEASIFKPDGKSSYALVARVQAADWASLAKSP